MNATRTTRSAFGAGHLAWLAMLCSILIWGIGDVQRGELGNTGNWYRIALVLFAAAVTAFGLLTNASRLSQGFGGPVVLLLTYGIVGMVSALYIPQHSLYSMWKASEFVIDVLAIAVVMCHPRPQESARVAYQAILILFAALVVVYWAEALLFPSLAFLPSRGLVPFTLQGVMPVMNGNAVAFMSAVVALAAWCRLLRGRGAARIFWLGVLLAAFCMLILAQSRTSLIGFVVAFAVQLFFDRRFGLLLLLLMFAAVVAASTQFMTVTEEFLVRGQSRELVGSLSGRTLAWEAAWSSFKESPVIGHGFAAAARAEILGTTGASTLHGAVFDVLVGVGLLGLIPWAAAILWTCLRLVCLGIRGWAGRRDGSLDRSMRAEMLGVLALILVRSTTSSGLALHEHTFMVFLAVLAFTATALRARRHALPTGARDRVQGFVRAASPAKQAKASIRA